LIPPPSLPPSAKKDNNQNMEMPVILATCPFPYLFSSYKLTKLAEKKEEENA